MVRGLSPFDNHANADPPLWDGVAAYRHSRFLYPPLVAWAFVPFTGLPYVAAKAVWTGLVLAALVAALWPVSRTAGLPLDATRVLALGAIVAGFFPVLSLLERGQIDSLVLLVLVIAIGLLVVGRKPHLAGALLAVATAIKLHGLFLVPFLVARRRWRVLAGLAAGGVAFAAVSFVVHGPAPLRRYLTEELPRISRYGDLGPGDTRLPPQRLRELLAGVPAAHTRVEGRLYRVEALSFELNASVVRTPLGKLVWERLRSATGLALAPASVSLVFAAVAIAIVLSWQRWRGPPHGSLAELSYWLAALVVILLCAPLTWAMATVWLLPVAVVVLRALGEPAWPRIPVALCIGGLCLAGVPDPALRGVPALAPWKYVIGEALCLAGLLGFTGSRRRP